MPDKTAFATLLMATKGNGKSVFVGACAAFFVQSAVAVTCGGLLSLFPEKWVHLTSGILFLIFAFLALRRDHSDGENEELEHSGKTFWKAVMSSFSVIFIAEWGDLTQLATASLEARYRDPLTIFVAATLALWVVTGFAVVIGIQIKDVLRPVILNRIAAVAFGCIGLFFIFSWFK